MYIFVFIIENQQLDYFENNEIPVNFVNILIALVSLSSISYISNRILQRDYVRSKTIWNLSDNEPVPILDEFVRTLPHFVRFLSKLSANRKVGSESKSVC